MPSVGPKLSPGPKAIGNLLACVGLVLTAHFAWHGHQYLLGWIAILLAVETGGLFVKVCLVWALFRDTFLRSADPPGVRELQ